MKFDRVETWWNTPATKGDLLVLAVALFLGTTVVQLSIWWKFLWVVWAKM